MKGNNSVRSEKDILASVPTKLFIGGNWVDAEGGKTLTVSDSTTLATNAITLGGGEVITFSATNAPLMLYRATSLLACSASVANSCFCVNPACVLFFFAIFDSLFLTELHAR
jgi:hypothetical protein